MTEFQKLSAEWHSVLGTDIPQHIACLSLEAIRNALSHARRRYQPVSDTSGSDESMLDDDNHNKY